MGSCRVTDVARRRPSRPDVYEAHDRIIAGPLDDHLARIATLWIDRHQAGETTAMVASSNDHIDAINAAVQAARISAGHLDLERSSGSPEGNGPIAVTSSPRAQRPKADHRGGETVRNRETWTVTAVHPDGGLTVTQDQGHGSVRLPVEYVRHHVRLGYAATEHGYSVRHRHRRHRARRPRPPLHSGTVPQAVVPAVPNVGDHCLLHQLANSGRPGGPGLSRDE